MDVIGNTKGHNGIGKSKIIASFRNKSLKEFSICLCQISW